MKWTPDDHGCIYDETGCFARLTPNKAERLASRHNADIDALTAERDTAIDEKLFWVDKYAYEMEKSDRRCDQWQRCFRLAFELKSRYFNQLRVMTAERDELQRRLDAICNWIDTNNDNGAGEAIYAIAEGRHNE